MDPPADRQRAVAAIKAALEQGVYVVDPLDVAEAVLEDLLGIPNA